MLKKRIVFIYRYFRSSRRWRRWINAQSLMVTVVSAVFLVTLAWTAPDSTGQVEQARAAGAEQSLSGAVAQAVQATRTPSGAQDAGTNQPPVEPTRTPTPYPPEYLFNSNQTIGVTLAGTVLVLIVVIGVLLYLPKKNEE